MGNQAFGSNRLHKAAAVPEKVRGKFVVEVVSAGRVPKVDIASESDPYVRLRVTKADGRKAKGIETRTLHRRDAADATFFAFRDLGTDVEPDDILHVTLWDHDNASRDDQLARLQVKVSDLSAEAKTFEMKLHKKKRAKGRVADGNPTVTLRRVPDVPPAEKTIFFIRHGESKWNEAQGKGNVGKMVAFDHGLNGEGVEQAQELNHAWKKVAGEQVGDGGNDVERKGDGNALTEAFLNPDIIYSSPLTRAAATAMLALHGHPALDAKGLVFLRTIREIKNRGGLDTVGKEVGDGVPARVKSELGAVLKGGEEEAAKYIPAKMDLHDAVTKWWTPVYEKDQDGDLDKRYFDFVSTLALSPHKVIICVGHSLFFREFFRRYSSPALMKSCETARTGAKRKMGNGACVALKMRFSGEYPAITDAELMFGTKFK